LQNANIKPVGILFLVSCPVQPFQETSSSLFFFNFVIEHRWAVLMSLYGAENFGHHTIDVWYPAFIGLQFLKSIYNRFANSTPTDGNAVLVVPCNCGKYDYSLAGPGTFKSFSSSCKRIMSEFRALARFEDVLSIPRNKAVCFKRLLLVASFNKITA
jgi:hypothetical protein